MTINFSGRKVEVSQLGGDLGEGAYATCASWQDTDIDLTDAELDQLNDSCQEQLYDEWYQIQVGKAEDMADAREDR